MYIYLYIHAYTWICQWNLQKNIFSHAYIYIHLYMYICIYIYMYTHIGDNISKIRENHLRPLLADTKGTRYCISDVSCLRLSCCIKYFHFLCTLLMPYWTSLCVLRRTCRQSRLYGTLFHCNILSKHHHQGSPTNHGTYGHWLQSCEWCVYEC
jgi:hypothetical protein